ncbi:HEXXH motif-containing putative peptide modification protein [Streptomyces scopuliridis]|uniref:aKG-HExxH-type peptide beta-hydroxylase n=1 Tax=Streptomyces scopuliridis TaxID=452529 RepID=UPI0036B13E19
MSPVVPEPLLRELGRTEGGSEALGLLVRDQHTRRLVLLRALLDAASAAPAAVCPPGRLDRLRQDWALLEAAERADRAAARSVLLHPLAGPWAQRCLRGLTAAAPTPELTTDLAHFSALAAAAAIRAGLSFQARLTAPDGLLVLPTLGALRTGPRTRTAVDIAQTEGVVTLRQDGLGTVTVRLGEHGARSGDPRWLPVLTLPAVLPGAAPVPLDDLDPYRTAGSGLQRFGLSSAAGLDSGERAAWRELWAGVAPMLRIGGAHRTAETVALLRCLVPLSPPPGSTTVSSAAGCPSPREGAAQCSGTRREAFGAILSSKPATAAHFASTLVHELQHTKLAALADLTPLHHEDATPRHFAPWRPDARPFDGLLQGAYSHIALADYWQRCALGTDRSSARDLAWAEHARCQEQVGAVLPVLAASGALTPAGRVLVNEMIFMYHRLADTPPPPGHLARAVAYVGTARMIWRQRNAS